MASELSRRDAENQVIRLCHSGVDGLDLRQGIVHSLRRMMPIDAAFFATADPETLLITGGWAEQPLGDVAQIFMENEFGQSDVNKFANLATTARNVSSLDDATHGDRMTSLRYSQVMRPIGLGDELRAALTVGDECWGYLCLHREDGPLGFTSGEAAALQRLAPHIAHALRREAVLTPASDAHEKGLSVPGVLVLSDDFDVLAMTPQAEQLLDLIEPYGAPGLPLPAGVYSVAMALAAVERGTSTAATLPVTEVRTKLGGRMKLAASRLHKTDDAGQIAVVLELVPAHASTPRLLAAYGLTGREAEVATLVLRGNSTDAITAELHISRHTVQDHLKSVFDKIGVRSRRELIGRLLRPHE